MNHITRLVIKHDLWHVAFRYKPYKKWLLTQVTPRKQLFNQSVHVCVFIRSVQTGLKPRSPGFGTVGVCSTFVPSYLQSKLRLCNSVVMPQLNWDINNIIISWNFLFKNSGEFLCAHYNTTNPRLGVQLCPTVKVESIKFPNPGAGVKSHKNEDNLVRIPGVYVLKMHQNDAYKLGSDTSNIACHIKVKVVPYSI